MRKQTRRIVEEHVVCQRDQMWEIPGRTMHEEGQRMSGSKIEVEGNVMTGRRQEEIRNIEAIRKQKGCVTQSEPFVTGKRIYRRHMNIKQISRHQRSMVAQQHLRHRQKREDQSEEGVHQRLQLGPVGVCQALGTCDSPARGGHEWSR